MARLSLVCIAMRSRVLWSSTVALVVAACGGRTEPAALDSPAPPVEPIPTDAPQPDTEPAPAILRKKGFIHTKTTKTDFFASAELELPDAPATSPSPSLGCALRRTAASPKRSADAGDIVLEIENIDRSLETAVLSFAPRERTYAPLQFKHGYQRFAHGGPELRVYSTANGGSVAVCDDHDPKGGVGGCPISTKKAKQDISYVGDAELTRLHDETIRMKLATYRYKGPFIDPNDPKAKHLGFIVEDQPSSLSVDRGHDRVDLYGYMSMAVATMQVQERQIATLKKQVDALEACCPRKAPAAR